jgi:hypothetical protein
MPRDVTLTQQNLSIERSRDVNPETGELEPIWTIVCIDTVTGDVTRIVFATEVRDFVVKGLTGGIVIASNGDAAT